MNADRKPLAQFGDIAGQFTRIGPALPYDGHGNTRNMSIKFREVGNPVRQIITLPGFGKLKVT